MSNHSSDLQPAVEIARSALRDILAPRARPGAPLKVMLTQSLRERGVDPFQFFKQYPKFSAFLAANSDLVEVSPTEAGDILVRLRAVPSKAPSAIVRLRPDVWKAFTNPDPTRKRYFHRDSAEIHHFTEPALHPSDQKWARIVRADSAYVEVDYATASTQSAWMQQFLESSAWLPDWIRRAAKHLVDVPYESSVESAFSATLGPQFGESWRQFRSRKVTELVQQWAARMNVALDRVLLDYSVQPPPPAAPSMLEDRGDGKVVTVEQATAREIDIRNLRAVLDLCSDDELSRIMLPASAVARVLRQRQ